MMHEHHHSKKVLGKFVPREKEEVALQDHYSKKTLRKFVPEKKKKADHLDRYSKNTLRKFIPEEKKKVDLVEGLLDTEDGIEEERQRGTEIDKEEVPKEEEKEKLIPDIEIW